MLLTNGKIESMLLVRPFLDSNKAASSHYVSIGTIITSGGHKCDQNSYAIQPQEIVWVVSSEKIALPADVTAFATIRTSLCNSGILALNIGIVDPGWEGPISTALINFSNRPYVIHRGEKFLRLAFHQHNDPDIYEPHKFSYPDYINERLKISGSTFGKTFLDIDKITEDVTAKQKESSRENFLYRITAFGSFVTVVAILLTVVAYIFPYGFNGSYKDIIELRSRIETLEKKVTPQEPGR